MLGLANLSFMEKLPDIETNYYSDFEPNPQNLSILDNLSSCIARNILKYLNDVKSIRYSDVKRISLNFRDDNSDKKSSGLFAYHLRNLKKHGLVVDVDGFYSITHRGKQCLNGLRQIEQAFNFRMCDLQ